MTIDIGKALESATEGGQFAAENLLSGNQTLIFATGLTGFIRSLLIDDPEAKLTDVSEALRDYAVEQARKGINRLSEGD